MKHLESFWDKNHNTKNKNTRATNIIEPKIKCLTVSLNKLNMSKIKITYQYFFSRFAILVKKSSCIFS